MVSSVRMALAAMALTTIGAAPAMAQNCAAPATTLDMIDCGQGEYAAADAELNHVYGLLKQRVSPAQMSKIRIAQRAWITFRDATCDAEGAAYEGGSLQPVIVVNCLTRQTRARTADLMTYLNP